MYIVIYVPNYVHNMYLCMWMCISVCMKLRKQQRQSSRSVLQKGVLRNFAKFLRRQPCQSLFFNKVAGLRPATLLKKRLWHSCFPVNFVKFLRTPFFIEHLWWLLLEQYDFPVITTMPQWQLMHLGRMIYGYTSHIFVYSFYLTSVASQIFPYFREI